MAVCRKCGCDKKVYTGGAASHLDRYIGWCKDCLVHAVNNEKQDWLKEQYKAIFG